MDTLYDATFYNWLKSEDNVVVISMYLHRIANQYPLPRIINALKWLISDWRLESIAVLVKQVTVDWKGNEGMFCQLKVKRARVYQCVEYNVL